MGTTYIKLNSTDLKRIYKKESIWWSAKYTINFNTQIRDSSDSAGSWETSSAIAEYGDILVVSTENSTRTRTITCYRWDSPNDKRWSNTVTWPDNTAQYTYADFNTSLTDSKIVEGAFTITASCTRTLNSYTITWKYLEAYPDTWTSHTQTCEYGVTPSRTAPNVTSGTLRNYFMGWDSLDTVIGNRTITAQYQHQGYFGVTLENCTQTDGHPINKWYPYGTTCSISVKSNTNWAFDKTGTSTASNSFPVPKTLTISPGYIYVTTNGTHCTPSVKTGWHAHNTPCTWTPDTYYSFEEGGTQKSLTENLTIAGKTYNKEPQYVRVERIDNGPYVSSATINNYTYYPKDTQVQWTAAIRYSYGGESAEDMSSGTTIIPGGVMTAPNPGYIECIVEGINCTANKVSAILAVGTKITYTASSGYSFAEGTARTATSIKTVVLGTTSYSGSADYKFITISGTNCTADISTGYRKLGNIITWTGTTNETNSKYSFSNVDKDAVVTDTIVTASGNYARQASYLWYNVTSATGTNCKAYTWTSYSTSFVPGWYLSGTKIYWKATGSAYAMTTSNATTLNENVKAGNNDKSAVVKQYTFTLTKNANVSSIKVWRTNSPYQGATIGSENSPLISNNNTATVYYGDVLNGKATSSTGYNFNGTNTTTSITYASGSITADKSWSPTVSKNTYTVNLDLSTLPLTISRSDQWLSLEKNTNATHYPVGSIFNYNDTIYAIIKIQGTPTGIDTTASGWTQIYSNGQYNTYVIGSITATGTSSSFTITPQVTVKNYTVNITAGFGYDSVYLSTDPNAISGSPSGTTFPYNSTVYSFGKLNVYTSSNPGTLVSGTSKSPGAIYRLGSKIVPDYAASFGEVTLDSNIVTAKFTGAGKDTGSINYLRFPQSSENYGSLSQKYSGYNIDIICNGYNYSGDSVATPVASFAYTAPYTATCTLKTHEGQVMPWNTKYDFTTGGGIAFEIDLTSNSSTYILADGEPVTVTLSSGDQMLVQNTGTATSPRLGFSADFDLVVVSQNCHFGSYEVYGSYATAPIYIFDHNNYEYDWEGNGDGEAEGQFVMEHYTPIGIITYDSTNNSIMVSSS